MEFTDPRYRTARSVLNLLEALGWILVVIGIIVAFTGFSSGGLLGTMSRNPHVALRFLAALPGLGTALGGLFLVDFTQVGRAGVDTAEYSRESLVLLKRSGPSAAPREADNAAGNNPKLTAQR